MNTIPLKELFNILPFNSYFDLIQAIKSGKAEIRMTTSTANFISSITKPYLTLFGFFLGFIITTILLIIYSFYFKFYWNLLLIPINLFLVYTINHLKILNKISWLIIIIDFFITKLNVFFLIFSFDILLMSFGYNRWWNFVYNNSINVLSSNKDAFIIGWNRNGISIVDSFGNMYFSYHNQIILEKD